MICESETWSNYSLNLVNGLPLQCPCFTIIFVFNFLHSPPKISVSIQNQEYKMVFCVRTASFHVIPASCQHPLRTLVICKIQNSLSKNSWMILFFYTVELLEPLGHRPQVHFAGIKEYEFSNNPFPSTWLLRLNIRKRFFFFLTFEVNYHVKDTPCLLNSISECFSCIMSYWWVFILHTAYLELDCIWGD